MGTKVNATEAAALVDRTERRVREWIRQGKLRAEPIGPRQRAAGKAGPSAWAIDVDELASVPGVTINRERLAEIAAGRGSRAPGGVLARLAELEARVRVLEARLRAVEAHPPAATHGGDGASTSDSAPHLAASGPAPDYYRSPAFLLSAIPVQHEAGEIVHAAHEAPPPGAIQLATFAALHGVSVQTAQGQRRNGTLAVWSRQSATRAYVERWVTLEQQATAVAEWERRGQLKRRCDRCPHTLGAGD